MSQGRFELTINDSLLKKAAANYGTFIHYAIVIIIIIIIIIIIMLILISSGGFLVLIKVIITILNVDYIYYIILVKRVCIIFFGCG